MKRSSSSVAGENDSHPAVKLVKLSSSSNKQPSIVSKTASALKLRYSSIISTRRGSAAAASESADSVVDKSAITMKPGCRDVTDCVVTVERCGSVNPAYNSDAAVHCIDEAITTMSVESAADTSELSSGRTEQSEQPNAAECGNTLHPDTDDVLIGNDISNPNTTEIECSKENDSFTDTFSSQCQDDHAVSDSDVGNQSSSTGHHAVTASDIDVGNQSSGTEHQAVTVSDIDVGNQSSGTEHQAVTVSDSDVGNQSSSTEHQAVTVSDIDVGNQSSSTGHQAVTVSDIDVGHQSSGTEHQAVTVSDIDVGNQSSSTEHQAVTVSDSDVGNQSSSTGHHAVTASDSDVGNQSSGTGHPAVTVSDSDVGNQSSSTGHQAVADIDVGHQSSSTKHQAVSENDVTLVQPTAEQQSVNDEVSIDESDNRIPAVTVDDKVVTSDQSNAPAPCTDVTICTSTDCVVSNASDELVTIRHSNQLCTTDVARNINVSEGKFLPVDFPVTTISSDISASSSISGAASGTNEMIQSTDKVTSISAAVSETNEMIQSSDIVTTSLQVCHTSEHGMERGPEWTSSVRGCIMAQEENSTSNNEVSEDAMEYLQSVYGSRSVSKCNCDSSADSVHLISVDAAGSKNLAETESCRVAASVNDVSVAGVLSTGTDTECDHEGTLRENISTLCRVSQPVTTCTATTPLHSADTATSVTSKFPFLEFLVTQSKLSQDSAGTSQSSICVSTALTVSSTAAASCDAAVCSMSACLLSSESSPSPSSYSVARSRLSLPCQLSSAVPRVTYPSSQDAAVSESITTGMLCHYWT